MRNNSSRKIRESFMDMVFRRKPQSTATYYESVIAYLHISRVPEDMKEYLVLHSFYELTEENKMDYTCTIAEYIDKMQRHEVRGWAMAPLFPDDTRFNDLVLDYVKVDTLSKGSHFLDNPATLGQAFECHLKSNQAVPTEANGFLPYLPLYIFDYL